MSNLHIRTDQENSRTQTQPVRPCSPHKRTVNTLHQKNALHAQTINHVQTLPKPEATTNTSLPKMQTKSVLQSFPNDVYSITRRLPILQQKGGGKIMRTIMKGCILGKEYVRCPRCGKILETDERICPRCGYICASCG